MNYNELTIALISTVSALSGVALSEYFKRKERESLFSETIFQKKLSVYEDLFSRLEIISEKGFELLKDKNLTADERLRNWSAVVLPFAQFLDRNELYLNENIKLHAAISIIGVEEIPEMSDKKRKEREAEFNADIRKAMDMIKQEIGIKRLDKFFTKLNKPDLESRWTDYIKNLKSPKK